MVWCPAQVAGSSPSARILWEGKRGDGQRAEPPRRRSHQEGGATQVRQVKEELRSGGRGDERKNAGEIRGKKGRRGTGVS